MQTRPTAGKDVIMMRYFLLSLTLAVFVASSVEAAPELFSPSYFPWKEEGWGSIYKKVERVQFNQEAILLPQRGIGPQALALSAGTDRIYFPIDGVRYEATVDFAKGNASGVTLFSQVDGEFFSHFLVGESPNAEIWLPNGGHRSLITRDEVTYLVELDWNKLTEIFKNDMIADGTMRWKRRAVRSATPAPCSGEEVENIDLMMPYTPLAAEWFSKNTTIADREIRAAAQNGVDAINAITINSTGGKTPWVNLVHVFRWEYVDAGSRGGWQSEDHLAVRTSPEVLAQRDLYDADAVILLLGFCGGSCGLAQTPGYPGEGFAVAYVGGGAFIIAHEFGHLAWDMQHNPEDSTGDPRFPFAFAHYVDGVNSGVMSQTGAGPGTPCPRGCPMAPVWDNPAVCYPGTKVPSGVKDQRENWRMIAIFTETTSHFRVKGNEHVCASSTNLSIGVMREVR